MNLRQTTLTFRFCLAVLVVLKRLANEQITNELVRRKTVDNLHGLIRSINAEINLLYSQEGRDEEITINQSRSRQN